MNRSVHKGLKYLVLISTLGLLSACAHLTGKPAKPFAFVGKPTKIEMWRPTFAEVQRDYRSKNPKMPLGTVIVTNSCGKIRAEFDVVVSTKPMADSFSLTSSIGEWCKQPFLFQKEHFVEMLGEQVVFSKVVEKDGRGGFVVEMSEDQLQYYNRRSDLNLLELQGSGEAGKVMVSIKLSPDPDNPSSRRERQ